MFVGGDKAGTTITTAFRIMEIRVWKTFVDPSVARSVYSLTTKEMSNFYWKLYPFYQD